MSESLAADLVVLGGGMAGTTAALAAAQRGARVVLVEKTRKLGGSALLSGGLVWCALSYEDLRGQAPGGDAELQATLVRNFCRLTSFIRGTGTEVGPDVRVAYGQGNRIDFIGYQRRAVAAVTAAGGVVAVGAQTSHLLTEGDRVVGVRVTDADGVTDLSASAVILATGGFQGSRYLMDRYLGERAARLLHRANPGSTGDGLLLAQAVGGVTAGNMAAYYGHLVPTPLAQWLPGDFLRFAVMFSTSSLLVNRLGARFTREWLGYYFNAQRVAEQDQGRAVAVFDARTRRAMLEPFVRGGEVLDTFGDAAAAGARTATAATLDELAGCIQAWGYPKADLVALAAEQAREAARDGADVSVAEAEFHALEVRPAITATEGGLRIDGSARVLCRGGQPIAGLYAAGADIGGVYDGGYAGGLSLAGTFALLAVDHAL
jgi:succinate dehydrogenase/fumarate reductase flavoprotein subunit